MRLIIPSVLPTALLPTLLQRIKSIPRVDGVITAGWAVRDVKQNEQLDIAQSRGLIDEIRQIIGSDPTVRSTAWPEKIHSMRISRYGVGMSYGRHVDNPIMNGDRCDLSFTLFLSDTHEYVGGELVLEGPDGEQACKLPAGSMLLYPSGLLHRVEPVTSGDRWVVVGWIQSQIRDPRHREVLFELNIARMALYEKNGKTNEFDLISKSLYNLVRLWAE